MKKGWGILAKRILVVGLTVSLVGGTIDVSALTVSAQTTQGEAVQAEQEEKGQTVQDENVQTMQGEAMRGTQETMVQTGQEKTAQTEVTSTEQEEAQQGQKAQKTMVTVTSFAALSDNIAEQKLPVGAEESDIHLPKTLTVTVEKTVTEETDGEKQDDQDSGDAAEDGKKQEPGTGTGDGKKPEAGTGNGKEDQPESGTDDGNADQPESGAGNGKAGQSEDGADNGNAGQPETGAGNGNAGQSESGADNGNAGQPDAGADNGNAVQSESGADTENGKPQSTAEDTESAAGIVGRLADWFFAPMTVHAAEDNSGSNQNAETESGEMTEQVRLTGITWEIDAQESDAPEFDGSKDGFCYVYQPVLPYTDGNGNSLTLADGVELPAIYVLVGEYGIATLEDEGVVEVTINNGDGVCYATLKEALEEIQEYVINGKGPNYTLKFLKDITEEQVNQQELYLRDSADLLTIDLNGCEIGYKEGDIWQTDVKDFGIKFTGDGRIQLIDSSAGQNGYFHGVLQVGGGVFTINAGTYEDIELYGTVRAHLDGGACKGSISVGASDTESNSRSVFCEMTQGSYNRVDVYQDAQLKVREDVEIAVLRAHHTAEEKAEVILFGGYYGEIETIIPDGMEDSLEDSDKGFAIEDMLEDGFAFYNGKGELQEIERTTTTVTDVSVLQATVDSENAAVRIDVVKKSGGQESFYYATWAQVTKALSGDGNKKDQFGNWDSVKVVLLKNIKARGEAVEWSVDSNVPRNITVCSEEGNHYTLTGASGNNVLLDVGGCGNSMVNLTLENIRIDGGCILARETNLTLEKGVAVSSEATITVKKAIPYISVQPTAAGAYTHGDYLYNQQLNGTAICGNGMGGPGAGGTETEQPVSGTFTWKSPSTKLSYRESNGKTYEYVFTPDDTTSFEIVTGSVTVTVNKAEYPPRNPAGINGVIYAAHSCEKVGNVELPHDWVWDETDAEKPLVEGQTTADVHAEYTGADKDNYKTTRISISIVRSSCEHARTEVQNVVKATCSRKGNSGKIYCLDCKQYINPGYLTEKDAANHTALTETVIRQATTAQTGLKARECKDCGYYAEVTIPKLSGGNTGGGNSDPGQQPEITGSNTGNDNQNPSGGNGGGSNNGGQSTANTPENTKPQTTTQQPATGKDNTKPGSTEQNQTDRTGQGDQNRDTKEPYVKGENGKEGWSAIQDEVTEAKEGETVSIHMNGATTVPGDVLSQISGKDITLVLDMGNGITWSINGKSFTREAIGDINFGVTYGERAGKNIPMDVINNVTGERYSMNLTLAYDGEFGFGAVLSINMDSKNEGLYANLFYYNPENGELEFICAGQIGEDGNAELTFTHASDYTIVIDTQPMDGTGAQDTIEDTGKTETAAKPAREADEAGMTELEKDDADGVTGWIMLIVVILAAAAGVGAVTLQRRKKQQEKE